MGLLHGRMRSADKDQVMEEFRQGKIQILVATTVVEVGMDVPNAGIMIIENADRFGLAQLHQLRGRVGRGNEQAYCFLLSQTLSPASMERLQTFTSTNDGFEIAKKDLELRGPGDFFGTRQHGVSSEELMGMASNMALLGDAQQAAKYAVAHEKEEEFSRLVFRAREIWQKNMIRPKNL